VIRLHRLGHRDAEPVHLNPDLILMVEATPDTVVTLTMGTKFLVAERPEEVVEAIRAWRASVLAASLPVARRRPASTAALSLVRGASGDVAAAQLAADHQEDRRS